MTDLYLFHEDDGGNIEFVNGQGTMSPDGLETAAYLSMFGGAERDNGLEDGARLQWWANLDEPDPSRQYRSQTQYLLRSLPAIPANLRRIEEAANGDLAWFTEDGTATFVGVKVTMPALNTVKIAVRTEVDGRVFLFEFTRPWGVTGS